MISIHLCGSSHCRFAKINPWYFFQEGCEIEVCTMLIDSNAMERTFQPFFSLQAERFCHLRPVYVECFLECLKRQYETIHRLETNKLRNTAKFFAHLFYTGKIRSISTYNDLSGDSFMASLMEPQYRPLTVCVIHFLSYEGRSCDWIPCIILYWFPTLSIDALPWSALELFVITEEATTSASRIFIKVLFQELASHMGLRQLNDRLHDATLAPFLQVRLNHLSRYRMSLLRYLCISWVAGTLYSSLYYLKVVGGFKALPVVCCPREFFPLTIPHIFAFLSTFLLQLDSEVWQNP